MTLIGIVSGYTEFIYMQNVHIQNHDSDLVMGDVTLYTDFTISFHMQDYC